MIFLVVFLDILRSLFSKEQCVMNVCIGWGGGVFGVLRRALGLGGSGCALGPR